MLDTTIKRPDNPAHYMRVKPVGRRVLVTRGETVLADSTNALRVMENGRDLYDPVIYIPVEDVSDGLTPVDGKSTHCPLKGDASYLSLEGVELAWTYDRPHSFSAGLKDHVAFYADLVTVAEIGGAT